MPANRARFAVVADEVRKLAERTTASTDAINGLVASMQNSGVRRCAGWVRSTNRSPSASGSDSTVGHIDGIRDSAQQVVAAVTDISEALNEQNATAHAIAQQVETVARLSETNSATARETETISANLDRLSSNLKTATGKFRFEVMVMCEVRRVQLFELRCPALLAFLVAPVLQRRHADLAVEAAGEVVAVVEAAGEGDLGHGLVGFLQHAHGAAQRTRSR